MHASRHVSTLYTKFFCSRTKLDSGWHLRSLQSPSSVYFLNRFKCMPTVLLKFSFLDHSVHTVYLSESVMTLLAQLIFCYPFLSIFVINWLQWYFSRRLILVIDAYGIIVALFCAVFSLSGFPYSHDYPGIFLSGSILGGCSALFYIFFLQVFRGIF